MKELGQICTPDIRFSYLSKKDSISIGLPGEQHKSITLEEYYEEVSCINLHESVSRLVQDQFDIAKNTALYAWFVWEFFDLAAHKALDCFELALKDLLAKAKTAGHNVTISPDKATLSPLINCAVKLGILKEERKESKSCRIEGCNRKGKDIRCCNKGISCPEKYITVASYLLWLRNHFSHAHHWVTGTDALRVMQQCADIISAMYTGETFSNYNNGW